MFSSEDAQEIANSFYKSWKVENSLTQDFKLYLQADASALKLFVQEYRSQLEQDSKMKCKQLENLPVISESQQDTFCPKCNFYYKGQCSNPNRKTEDGECPFDGKILPTEKVKEESNNDS